MEFPCLQSLWLNYQTDGMQLVVVHESASNQDSDSDVLYWIKQLLKGAPTFVVLNEATPDILNTYAGNAGVPHDYIIGRDMIIRKDILGFMQGDCGALETALQDVLAMPAPPPTPAPTKGTGNPPHKSGLAVDPMALILPEEAYLIWAEMHHPNVPPLSEVQAVLRTMTPKARNAALTRAKTLVEYGKAYEKAMAALERSRQAR